MENRKQTKKNGRLLLITAVIVTVCLAVMAITSLKKGLTASNVNNSEIAAESEEKAAAADAAESEQKAVAADEAESEQKVTDTVSVAEGEALIIPLVDVTTEASFFPVEVNGTKMEVIAVKDSEGNFRTAFNTCQVCYDSGRGYYVQSGDNLVCQNCGNRFSMEQVGIESGGCNPWPIFDENKTITADEISISYDFLAESQNIFTYWKNNY